MIEKKIHYRMPKEISGLTHDCPLCNWLMQKANIRLTDKNDEVTCRTCNMIMKNEKFTKY